MNWKETYTKIFLSQLNKSTDAASVKQYQSIWWKNTRDKGSGGLRLSDEGYEAIMEIGMATYDIPFPKDMPLTAQSIIFLDQFIDCPYYLFNHSVVVTTERKAVELTLFAGDIRKYGIIKATKRLEKNNTDSD